MLRLKPTVDILATLGRAKRRQIIIAFALEVQSPLRNARLKLRRKNADAIVLNSPAAIGALRSDATILLRSGARLEVKQATKQRMGRILVALAESLCASEQAQYTPPEIIVLVLVLVVVLGRSERPFEDEDEYDVQTRQDVFELIAQSI